MKFLNVQKKWSGFFTGLLLSSSLLATPALAQQSVRRIPLSQAQGLQKIETLQVSPIYGLVINYIPSGEVIKKVWIGDPTRIVVDFDSLMCTAAPSQPGQPGQQGGQSCGATVMRIRQLGSPLALNLSLTAQARSTNLMPLTVITTDSRGSKKLQQFVLQLGVTRSQSNVVEIVPDIKVAPKPPLTLLTRQPQKPETPEEAALSDPALRPIWRGMVIAVQRRLISSADQEKLLQFFDLAKQGSMSADAALAAAGLESEFIAKLTQLGR